MCSVARYTFNITNWTIADIKLTDIKTRKLTFHRMPYPKTALYLLNKSRFEGDSWLVQLEQSCKTTIISFQWYLETTEGWMMIRDKEHERNKNFKWVKKLNLNIIKLLQQQSS